VITGVGVVAGSSVVASTYSADTMKQHPLGTSTVAVDVMLPNSSTAAGVNIALLLCLASPLTVIAIAIGVTAPPVGIAILPLRVTLYLAILSHGHLGIPLRTVVPVPF
jgi:hypothetical protein